MAGSASRARRTSRPSAGDGLDAEQVAVGQRPAGLAGLDAVVVAGADDQVPGAGPGAVGDRDRGPVLDDAHGDEVVADAAVQLAAQRVIGGHQQRVGAACGQGDVGGRGGVHDLLGVSADDAAVLVVLGQDAGVAVAEPQAGWLFPGVAEPDGFGEPGVAEHLGEQGHAAAVFHRLQLAGVPGQDDLGPLGLGVGDQVGQVRAGQHRGLVDDQQGAGADGDGAAGAAPAGQVAQELRGVIRHRDSGGQGVAGGLGRGDADHRAEPGLGPDPGGLGQHPRLPGSGRRVDHRDKLAVGQRGQCGGGLVLAQPATGARVLRVARVVGASGQRGVEPRRVRAEPVCGLRASHARRAARAGLRDHVLLHHQLRARGIPGTAVPLVDAAPIRAQQASRHLRRLGRFQAGHRLEVRGQRPVGQVLQQRGGRGRIPAGAGQDPAQVLDQVRARPRALVLLRQRDRLLRRARQLELRQNRGLRAGRVRGRAAGRGVPHRRRDRGQARRRGSARACPPSPRAPARDPARRAWGCAS